MVVPRWGFECSGDGLAEQYLIVRLQVSAGGDGRDVHALCVLKHA